MKMQIRHKGLVRMIYTRKNGNFADREFYVCNQGSILLCKLIKILSNKTYYLEEFCNKEKCVKN